MQEFRVVLVEENRIMLERQAAVIRALDGFDLVAKFSDAQLALEEIGLHMPHLILLDIDSQKIDGVSAVKQYVKQFPKAGILCMSTQWDEHTAADMVRAGAKGYLIKPFTGDELVQAMASFGKDGMSMLSRVVAFFSPKGKSGKTTMIANLAMEIAEHNGQSVAIIDADLQFGDMAVFFNLEPKSTIVEAVRDIKFLSPVTLNAYFTPVNNQVKVLCGTRKPDLAELVRPKDLVELIHMARNLFDYVLVDVPPAFNPVSVVVSEAADVVYAVAMINGTYEIKHMQRALDIFNTWENRDEKLKVVFTRVEPWNDESQQRLSAELGYPVTAIVPNEYVLVSAAANNGRMAVDINPDSRMARSIHQLVENAIKKGRVN